MPGVEITENFLKALKLYLEGKKMEDVLDEANLKHHKQFTAFMRKAYQDNFLVLRAPPDDKTTNEMADWLTNITPFVVKDKPDDRTFYLSAAERFLIYLRNLLLDQRTNEVNIGIVSGSSTASVIERSVESGLWEGIMRGHKVFTEKEINVIALNSTPVVGWELGGNANIPTMKLAVMLQDKLPHCKVTPFGISTHLVVKYESLGEVDKNPPNNNILEITDPRRLGINGFSRLNLVITGVGTPDESVFQQVLDSEGIVAPVKMVGDVAFWPVDKEGGELELKKGKDRYVIYSAVSLETLKYLVSKQDCTVMLIARNSRRGKDVDKTKAIRAAIRGNYMNAIFTDANTAERVIFLLSTDRA